MLQPHGPMSQDCHRLAFDFEITMRHGHRRLFVTIRDELGIAIAAVIDNGFLHPAEARSGIGANIFETERFDHVHHVIGTTTVRDQNLSLLGSAWRLLCHHRLGDRSRACQHSTLEEFPPFHLALCRHAILPCRGGLFLRLRAVALALRGPPTMPDTTSPAVIDRRYSWQMIYDCRP